jgi:glycine betaine/proline transport system substrate-binding protein
VLEVRDRPELLDDYQLTKNITWTNDDQTLVATYITADGMKPEDAAKKWMANQDRVNAWLGKG